VAVLSVDLAFRRWCDLGVVILDHTPQKASADCVQITGPPPVSCEIVPFGPPDNGPAHARDPVDPENLAGRLNHLCAVRDIRVILLDGPQAWKSNTNGCAHARVSERQLNTAAKTGLPGVVKPLTYRAFAEFCMDVYDALCRRGWRRFQTQDHPALPCEPGTPPQRILVESYPHAAWRSLGLKPLPSKRRCKISDLADAYGALRKLIPFVTNRPPNHDQLQAIVGGLAGIALEENNPTAVRIVGSPPLREAGHWREGFIALPVPPHAPSNLRWLN
jgi:hypothetical protein